MHKLYHILNTETLANVFEYSRNLNKYINELSIRKKVDILLRFETTTIIECLRKMEKADRNVLLEMMDDDTKREIVFLSSFDEDETFIGAIDLKKLIIAREDTELTAITMTSYPYVYANELIEDCINRIVEYSEDSIPVLDSDNKLRGVLTSQDIMQFVGDEMGDDYAKLAGLSSEEDLQEPLSRSLLKRLPWLLLFVF